MKRKIIMLLNFIVLLLSVGAIGGCRAPEPTPPEFRLTATVTALGEKIEVDVTEGEYASGIYWVIVSDLTEIYDSEGNKIGREKISVGDTLEIVYNGQVMMSYPAQIAARKITLK